MLTADTIIPHNSAIFVLEGVRVLGVVPRGQRGPLGVERVVQDPGRRFRDLRSSSGSVVDVEAVGAAAADAAAVQLGR